VNSREMTGLASLPWYDLPGHHAALDGLWQTIRARLADHIGGDLPPLLERASPAATQWAEQRLLLSQCCGSDLFTAEGGELVPVARPVFADLDCAPGNYYSHIVSRGRIPANPRLAVNWMSSYSGCIALLNWLRDAGYSPGHITVSGSHQASLVLLSRQRVDVVAIDANTWNLLQPVGLDIQGRGEEAPAPPFVRHARSRLPDRLLRDALFAAFAASAPVAGMAAIRAASHADYQHMAAARFIPDEALP